MASLGEECNVDPEGLETEPRMLTWDPAREISGDLVALESPTHPNMGQVAEERARRELQISKGIIEAEVGVLVRSFAFPYNEPYQDPRRLAPLACGRGYRYACAGGERPACSDDDPYATPRLRVVNASLSVFARHPVVALAHRSRSNS